MITRVNDTNQIKGQFLTIKQSPKVIIILVLVQTGDATMSLGQCVCVCISKTELMRVCMCVEGRKWRGGWGDLVHTDHSSQWN